jgi:predicted nuclease of restriction endonuclease-like (RecB) superfamily
MSLVPDGYSDLVDLIGVEVRTTRLRAVRAANTELVAMNWRIGRLILERQQAEPWGSGVIKRLALDLRRQFPGMTGLSATNLQYMRAFAAAWPDQDPISQRSVGKLPWGHVCTLLDQLQDLSVRDWYAARDAANSWSRPVLEHHIATGLHRRIGAAPSNFADHLEPVDADQAQEIVKDPYVFDFLDLTERSREREIETALTERLQDTLAELGPGFAFVGRQVHLAVDGDDFLVDLLLFHAEQVRFICTIGPMIPALAYGCGGGGHRATPIRSRGKQLRSLQGSRPALARSCRSRLCLERPRSGLRKRSRRRALESTPLPALVSGQVGVGGALV